MIKMAVVVFAVHAFQHGGKVARRIATGNKYQPLLGGAAPGHALAQNFHAAARFVFQAGAPGVGGGCLVGGSKFNIVGLGAAINGFLRRQAQLLPAVHTVMKTLHMHIAAAGKGAISQQCHAGSVFALRVFGAVHKAGHIATVEITEALALVLHVHQPGQQRHYPLNADIGHIQPVGSQLYKEIGRSFRCSVSLRGKGGQFGRAGIRIEVIPDPITNGYQAGKSGVGIAAFQLTPQGGQPGQRGCYGSVTARHYIQEQVMGMQIGFGTNAGLCFHDGLSVTSKEPNITTKTGIRDWVTVPNPHSRS